MAPTQAHFMRHHQKYPLPIHIVLLDVWQCSGNEHDQTVSQLELNF